MPTTPTRAAAIEGRIVGYRGDTRDRRIEVAVQAEHKFGRKVSWGVRCGDTVQLFTHLTVPTMTRLRQPERKVLDTLVAGRGCTLAVGCARVVCPARQRQHPGVARRPAVGNGERRSHP